MSAQNIEDELFDLLNAPTPSYASSSSHNVDLDDLLGDSGAPVSPSKPSTQSIEDELFELLNSPSPGNLASTIGESEGDVKTTSEPAKATTLFSAAKAARAADHNELLSWLEETPTKSQVDISDIMESVPEPVPVVEIAVEEVPAQEEREEGRSSQQDSADKFFDDVFGNDTSSQPMIDNLSIEEKSVEDKVQEIISSPFPDIGKLRQVVDEAGHIPVHQRVQVLVLLLTGSCNVDEEAQKFVANESDRHHYHNVVSDCEGLVKTCTVDNDVEMTQHMVDIIILYCQRRSIEYKNLFSRILLSIYASDVNTPKSIASSCFYALASNFLPLAGLQYTPLEMSVDVLHSWLKLLLTYHCPSLVQHLDRVFPHWNKPARDISSNQINKYSNLLKNHINLESLEKQLGVDLEYEFESEVQEDEEEETAATEAPSVSKRLEGGGVISTSWITSFFAGSLPASESAKLLDWSVFNGERFAGLYFVVSLMELFSTQLQSMHIAADIAQWFENIATNKNDWFQQCVVGEQFDGKTTSWAQFTSAWIQATSVLIASTPRAFRDGLNQTEAWSLMATEKQRKEISNHLLGLYAVDKELDEALEGGHMFDEDEDDEYDDADNNADPVLSATATNSKARTAADTTADEGSPGDDKPADLEPAESTLLNKALDQLRTFGSKFQITEHDDSSEDEAVDLTAYPHDRKFNQNTLSLWSSASEVIPCVCTNQRKALTRKGVLRTFLDAIKSSNSNVVCFLLAKVEDELPFYFAIDCRSSEEKQLGQFPKAYNLDADTLADEESLHSLVSMLEPLAATIHIAIIGAGERYYRWLVKEVNAANPANKKGPKLHHKDLQHAVSRYIEDQEQRINFLIDFLIKKSFKFVSVLDGGFYEAVKYMNRPDSRQTISNSLIDVDKIKLNSLLGITTASAVNNKSAISTLQNAWNEAAPIAMSKVGSLISSWSSASSATTTASSPVPSTTTPTTAVQDTTPTPAAASKPMLSGWGKSINIMGSLENIKKAVVSTVEAQTNKAAPTPAPEQKTHTSERRPSQFVIDEHEDDGLGPKDIDPSKIGVVKTDIERAQALAIHRMAGLKKGDSVTISRAELPGAVLFPCTKIKEVWVPKPAAEEGVVVEGEEETVPAVAVEGVDDHKGMVKQEQVVNRYLVVSRERFMVLDAHGGGVGSTAAVKSNHHLTELIKMTFKKKDPELVTLHFFAADEQTKTRQYRVSKQKDFVGTLQKHMERFK